MVAQLNRVATVEEDLRHHLFGSSRVAPPKMLRDGLRDLQANRCFYCDARLIASTEVDHFIARVRSANDAIENLVLADRSCNATRATCLPHLRLSPTGRPVTGTTRAHWRRSRIVLSGERPHRHLGVARSIYAHLPSNGTPMWRGRKQVVVLIRAWHSPHCTRWIALDGLA